jgi:hypothetical protein
MSGNIKEYRTAILLLPLILAIGWGELGAEPESRKARKPESSIQYPASSIQHPVSSIQNSSEFGRENPFMPLITEAQDARHKTAESLKSLKSLNDLNDLNMKRLESSADSVIRLTAIFVANASSAIIEENGLSRSVYVGDMAAGMRVIEIRRGEVILGRGSKRYAVTLGILPEAIEKSEL